MRVLNNGYFTHRISGSELSKGLRKSTRNNINNDSMISCAGVVGRENVLEIIKPLTSVIDITSGILPVGVTFGGQNVTFGGEEVTFSGNVSLEFPFPQIFVTTNIIIICTKDSIYELDDGNLSLKYTTTKGGSTWSVQAVHDFVYLSNGAVSVVRDPSSKRYSLSDAPTAMAICNYNGQLIIGAPNAGYEL